MYVLKSVVTLSLICLFCLGFWLWSAVPKTSGIIAVNKLDSKVEIIRDSFGVPHIFSESEDNAYFALGFVHAQDRFWQMEIMRRFGAGRLSEIMGKRTVRIDKWMRALGLLDLVNQDVENFANPVSTD